MEKTIGEIITAMDLRFTSANDIPVERASIRRPEWDIIRAALMEQAATSAGR